MKKLLFWGCYLCGLVCLCNILLTDPWSNGEMNPTITALMSWQTVCSGASQICAAVYFGLLFCLAVVAGAHKQTSRSSFFCLLICSLVLLRSVCRFCLLLCQLYEKLLLKVDGPHALACLLFLIWLFFYILYCDLWVYSWISHLDLSFLKILWVCSDFLKVHF